MRELPQSRTIAIVSTTLASLLARLASLVSQVIVGLFVSQEQVGVYALALGVLGVTGIWRNGGAATFFPSVKPNRFDDLAPPLFLWATLFGVSTSVLTIAFGWTLPLLPDAFDRFRAEGLTAVLLVLATHTAIRPVSLLGRMRLSVLLAFPNLARLDAALAVLRVCLTWIVAREGGGALALALPITVTGLLEAIALGFMGGFKRADFIPSNWQIRSLWPALAWPLAFAILNSIRADILFLMVGVVVPATILGGFYFAYQLANQPSIFIGGALQNVLAPLSARFRGDPEAERRSIERTLSTSMLFIPVTTMAAASCFGPAERLFWAGKWDFVGPSVYWLSASTTYATTALLLVGSLLGLQRFRATVGFEAAKVAGVVASSLAAWALLSPIGDGYRWGISGVTLVSACIAVGIIGASLAQIGWVAKVYHIKAGDLARYLTFGPALGALTAISATSLATSIDDSLGIPRNRVGALYELLTVACVYLVLISAAIRFTAETPLRESISVLPAPLPKVLRRALFLN